MLTRCTQILQTHLRKFSSGLFCWEVFSQIFPLSFASCITLSLLQKHLFFLHTKEQEAGIKPMWPVKRANVFKIQRKVNGAFLPSCYQFLGEMPHEHPQSTPRDPSLILLAILCCNVYKESFATANNLECILHLFMLMKSSQLTPKASQQYPFLWYLQNASQHQVPRYFCTTNNAMIQDEVSR